MGRRKRHGKSLASAAAPAGADGAHEPGRFSARRKTETILRVLRGEPLDGLARELGVTASGSVARSGWWTSRLSETGAPRVGADRASVRATLLAVPVRLPPRYIEDTVDEQALGVWLPAGS